jgi:hypothetical protein
VPNTVQVCCITGLEVVLIPIYCGEDREAVLTSASSVIRGPWQT